MSQAFGVWVASRRRWARNQMTDGILRFAKVSSAITAAQAFQEEFPNERFYPSGIPEEPLDRGPVWTPQQVENRKTYWQQQRSREEVAA